MEQVPEIAREVNDEFKSRFGRGYGAIERYGKAEAEILLMTSGTVTSTSRIVAQKLNEKGISVAGIKIKRFRPFPAEEIYEEIKGAKKLAVIDRNLSAGVGGIFAHELRAALYPERTDPGLWIHLGIGGRDITRSSLKKRSNTRWATLNLKKRFCGWGLRNE